VSARAEPRVKTKPGLSDRAQHKTSFNASGSATPVHENLLLKISAIALRVKYGIRCIQHSFLFFFSTFDGVYIERSRNAQSDKDCDSSFVIPSFFIVILSVAEGGNEKAPGVPGLSLQLYPKAITPRATDDLLPDLSACVFVDM